MKKIVAALLVGALVLLVAAMLTTSAAAKKDPFIGKWYAPDRVDFSNQSLTIGAGPGGMYHIRYRDDGASLCGTDASGAPLYAATATGMLSLDDSGAITGDLPVMCMESPPVLLPGPLTWTFSFTYVPSTDTLTDGFGNTWNR